MSRTFEWCKDKTKLAIWDKQVFYVNCYGGKYWYLNGELHRENGPAVEWPNGYKAWYLNDKLHREDGPAAELSNGVKEWYINDKLHRVGGPAIERVDVVKYWYLNGEYYPESDYWKELNK